MRKTDIIFTSDERLVLDKHFEKITFPFPIMGFQAGCTYYWRKEMLKRGRLARFYAVKWEIMVADGIRGTDGVMDNDEMKIALAQIAHELTHAYHVVHHPIVHFIGKWLPFIPHKLYGCYANEQAVNKYFNREGASKI